MEENFLPPQPLPGAPQLSSSSSRRSLIVAVVVTVLITAALTVSGMYFWQKTQLSQDQRLRDQTSMTAESALPLPISSSTPAAEFPPIVPASSPPITVAVGQADKTFYGQFNYGFSYPSDWQVTVDHSDATFERLSLRLTDTTPSTTNSVQIFASPKSSPDRDFIGYQEVEKSEKMFNGHTWSISRLAGPDTVVILARKEGSSFYVIDAYFDTSQEATIMAVVEKLVSSWFSVVPPFNREAGSASISYTLPRYNIQFQHPSDFSITATGPNDAQRALMVGQPTSGTIEPSWETLSFGTSPRNTLFEITLFPPTALPITPKSYTDDYLSTRGGCDLRGLDTAPTVTASQANGVVLLRVDTQTKGSCYYFKNRYNYLIVVSVLSTADPAIMQPLLSTLTLL